MSVLHEIKRTFGTKASPVAPPAAVVAGSALALWIAIVLVAVSNHEFWRDEVRALSLALQANSLFEIPFVVHGEGHPALWYVLLRAGYDLFGKSALPVLSVSVAALSVIIFVWLAPFSLWSRLLFAFSGLPLFEYSVMARNYGLSMLLMFIAAPLFASPSPRYLALGAVLFLLAQTNVHSALIIPFLLLILVPRFWQNPVTDRPGLLACFVIATVGVIAAFATVYPAQHSMLVDHFVGKVPVADAVVRAIFNPGYHYQNLTFIPGAGYLPSPIISVMLYLIAIGLAPRWTLVTAAVGALWTLSLFFDSVWPAGYRHTGIWFIFVIILYWMKYSADCGSVDQHKKTGYVSTFAFNGVLTTLLVMNCLIGAMLVGLDYRSEMSKSKAVGEMIAGDARLRDAIILPEPEQIGEAISYYVNNDIYLAREKKFGKIATWSRGALDNLSLGDLLKIAQGLRDASHKPVLILLEWQLPGSAGTIDRGYGWQFSYSPDEVDELSRIAKALPLQRNAVVENFDAYLLD